MPVVLEVPGNAKVLATESAGRELGMAKLSKALMNDMRDLGVEVATAGIIHTDRGFSFATKRAVFRCVEQLEEKIEDPKADIHAIATSLAKCAKAIATLSSKDVGEPPKDPTPPRKAFAIGQNAQFHVHYHQKTDEPK